MFIQTYMLQYTLDTTTTTSNPQSTINIQHQKPIPTASKTHDKPSKTQTHDEQTQTHDEQTHDKPTTSKQWANQKPPTQIATIETQDQHTETQIVNRKPPIQLPPKSASHHYWNLNRNPLTKISTYRPKS